MPCNSSRPRERYFKRSCARTSYTAVTMHLDGFAQVHMSDPRPSLRGIRNHRWAISGRSVHCHCMHVRERHRLVGIFARVHRLGNALLNVPSLCLTQNDSASPYCPNAAKRGIQYCLLHPFPSQISRDIAGQALTPSILRVSRLSQGWRPGLR